MKKIIAFLKSLFIKAPVEKVSVEHYAEIKKELIAVSQAEASKPEVKKAPKKTTAKPATSIQKKKTNKSK